MAGTCLFRFQWHCFLSRPCSKPSKTVPPFVNNTFVPAMSVAYRATNEGCNMCLRCRLQAQRIDCRSEKQCHMRTCEGAVYVATVTTSQGTYYVSATEPNRLMLFGETVAVYCENHTEHTDTVRTSQETHQVSATEPRRLTLFGKTIAVYWSWSWPTVSRPVSLGIGPAFGTLDQILSCSSSFV
jgi:hypothetical protein